MDSIEDKYATFVRQCITAYSYRKQSLQNEKQLISIISELVSFVNMIDEKNVAQKSNIAPEMQTTIDNLLTRTPPKNIEEVIQTLTFIASTIEKKQLNDIKDIAHDIRDVIDSLRFIATSTDSLLQYNGNDKEQIQSKQNKSVVQIVHGKEPKKPKSAFSSHEETIDIQSVSKTNVTNVFQLLAQEENREIISMIANGVLSTTYSDIIVSAITDVSAKLHAQLQQISKENNFLSEQNRFIDTFEEQIDEPSGVIEISSMSQIENISLAEMKEPNDKQDETIKAKEKDGHINEEVEYTLPLTNYDELNKFLPKYTVFDAIPLNYINISVLCTPILAATKWEYIDKKDEEYQLCMDIKDMIDGIQQRRKESTSWTLE